MGLDGAGHLETLNLVAFLVSFLLMRSFESIAVKDEGDGKCCIGGLLCYNCRNKAFVKRCENFKGFSWLNFEEGW